MQKLCMRTIKLTEEWYSEATDRYRRQGTQERLIKQGGHWYYYHTDTLSQVEHVQVLEGGFKPLTFSLPTHKLSEIDKIVEASYYGHSGRNWREYLQRMEIWLDLRGVRP